MYSESAKKQVRAIVIAKETDDYRIVTEDPDNWFVVANRPISEGELVVPTGTVDYVDVCGVECVEIVLKETQEQKHVYTSVSAVPCDSSCAQISLEIPWCLINHSCEPNIRDLWNTANPTDIRQGETQASRGIAEGEELTYDYALEQYNYRSPFECSCGTESCRGTISGFKALSCEKQQQMLSLATPFVQAKFRRDSVLELGDLEANGRHLIIDFWDCDIELLNDEVKLPLLLNEAAKAAGANVISMHAHRFDPQGVTAFAILSESHIAIHTWPEAGYAGVDIYTCGKCDPLPTHELLAKELSSGRSEFLELTRGHSDSSKSIQSVASQTPRHTGLVENDTWFLEGSVPGKRHGNISHGFRISEVLFKKTTQFQECLIFDSPVYGGVLVLDGIVQFSTSDEHIYHEMLVHPSMFAHPNPQRVVIIGGGDGGALREVLQHNPKEVVMIDIDEQVIRAAAEYLPSLNAGAFEDSRVTLLFEDASEALRRYESTFDVAIIDCNGAVGPSEALFENDFYSTVARSLNDESICAVQAGSMMEPEFLVQMRERLETHFGRTTGFRLTLPAYHCGEYVFFGTSGSMDPSGPDSSTLAELQTKRGIITKHWSPAMHHASQVLPAKSTIWN